jgi:DNA repair exonuclease SbcCD ATPase subunit
MKIKSIKISNILSIEDAYVEFDDSGLMLVQGWNHDVGRANGAGKTAIFNAISFAIFDKLPRKITATEILRRGCRSGFVVVCIEAGSHLYSVKRSRPKGVEFQKEGNRIDLTQANWEHTIGLNYEQFILSMYTPQKSARFLSLNDADKKQFLLQLLNLEEFSSCKSRADDKVKTLNEERSTLQSDSRVIVASIDVYKESLVDENSIQYAVYECEENIKNLNLALIEAQQVSKPDLSKYQKLEEEIALKSAKLAEAKVKRELLHDSYKKLERNISRIPTYSERCGVCNSMLDTSSAKATYEKELEQHCVERDEIRREISSLDDVLSGSLRIYELSEKVRGKKSADSSAYESARARSNDAQIKLVLKQKELKELRLKLQKNSDLLSKINNLTGRLEQMASKEAMILHEIELYKTISTVYSPTGAQAYILDSVIDSFNERVGTYVGILWSNMTYELKSYKETVKGDVTAKFSEHLMMDGRLISIGSLSGGEFRALSLCVDFALIDVMERQFGMSLSPIILDEPFDGLDSAGREFMVELLEKFAYAHQVVVVDHANEVKSMFSKVIDVQKQDGVSRVSLQL